MVDDGVYGAKADKGWSRNGSSIYVNVVIQSFEGRL